MDDRPDLSPVIEAHASLAELLRSLLSEDEQDQIKQQFDRQCRRDAQVMWSGVPRKVAQAWADKRNLQTLTTAMGPLMDSHHPSCLRPKKSLHQWSIYMKGASALFACHITRSSKVTVLSLPPPQKFHPSGHTNYQLIEEPILKGMVGGSSVGCIQMVHPTVKGAEELSYQSWPVDRTEEWTEKFPHPTVAQISWRKVKIYTEMQCFIAIVSIAEKGESVANLPPQGSAIVVPQSLDETQIAMKKRAKEEEERKAREEKLKRKIANMEKEKEAREKKAEKRRADEEKVKKAGEEQAKRKKANEEKERKARDEKAKKKRENEEKERKAREEKAKRKKANKEREEKAREEKERKARDEEAKKKRANEEREKKAREKAERKKANEEKERKARDEKAKRKRANEEREKKARDEKAKRKRANEEREKKARDERAKRRRTG